ncbi:putative transcriptional regulatory protein [Botryosphaeria dothidea]|uniref:Transcriptional regulatory protein n=1 Tax=Botryosphaeria dothidea TaxID=55169 RepID=A0A8H4N5K6_9PEZI|nr:putative transcriptional regulatory protein [Botryosphaeria dothidea]
MDWQATGFVIEHIMMMIRCDKVHPCSPCRRSGVECVFPAQRAQRRKQGRRNEELLRRLDHLEGLVDRLGGEVAVAARAASGEPLPGPVQEPPPHGADGDYMPGVLMPHLLPPRAGHGPPPREDGTYPVMKDDGSRYVGEDFWTSLSTEVEGLRELLNEPESDEEPDAAKPSASSPPTHEPYEKRLMNSLFVFSGDIEATDLRWLHPSGPQIKTLSDIYWDRVDVIFKILHRPTIEPLLNAAAQDAAAIPKAGGFEALMFAIYFAAVTSLTPGECTALLGKERPNLVSQFRHCCEMSLANADFLNSTDLQVLQAFSLYLLCLRSHNKTRSVWTLVSLAVRIAQDLNLHRDGSVTGFSPFETEVRRRLWWQIVVLDIRACEDRGSFPQIDQSLCSTKVPLNINDDDINPQMRTSPPERTGCTDVSFSRLCQEASLIAPRFFSPVPAGVDDDQKREHWQTRIQQEVERFKERLHRKFLVHCNPAVPIQYVISQVVQIVTSEFWLLVHYPIQTRRYAFKSKATKQEILDSAITHLRIDHELEHHPFSVKYKWYYDTYVQWHPLAVALAELCVQTRGRHVDQAWEVVDAVYERARSRVTDVSLWRPVKKLHQKARKARSTALRAGQPLPTEVKDESMTSQTSSVSPASCSEVGTATSSRPSLDQLSGFASSRTSAYPDSTEVEATLAGFASMLPSGPTANAQTSRPQQRMPTTTTTTTTTSSSMDMLSTNAADQLSSMNLNAYGDPVNWQDWNDFVQSTWVADDPNAPQQKTNTPEWLLNMGVTPMGGTEGNGGGGFR